MPGRAGFRYAPIYAIPGSWGGDKKRTPNQIHKVVLQHANARKSHVSLTEWLVPVSLCPRNDDTYFIGTRRSVVLSMAGSLGVSMGVMALCDGGMHCLR